MERLLTTNIPSSTGIFGCCTDISQWEDDDISLRVAASRSFLSYDQPSVLEMIAFPEICDCHTKDLFLYLRNKMLQMWHCYPQTEVTLKNVLEELSSPYDEPLNYPSRRVIVIGAGIAGITAAQQLKNLGLDVLLLEARPRIGGRVSTFMKSLNTISSNHSNEEQIFAELGASSIYGALSNPLMTVIKQFEIQCNPVLLDSCALYNSSGTAVELSCARLIERLFHNFIYASSYLSNTKNIFEAKGQMLSLKDAFDIMLKEEEYILQARRISFLQSYHNILKKLQIVQDSMVIIKNEIQCMSQTYKHSKEMTGGTDWNEEKIVKKDIAEKCIRKDIDDAINSYESLQMRRETLRQAIEKFKRDKPRYVVHLIRRAMV
ncbi:unnamed protein product [Thelazia callipaeda]|uniref:Amino_oxidase domain-containing protein n=1 Tax=Thelazia callipaeda TaxID=103827 RepID=A0A0N5CW93_THECL|nr:unnamed protein product [Thelazia callipaeda]